MAEIKGPAPRPCESCPYRQDVPSGVWEASEYDKLPGYDRETFAQPMGVFLCHQRDGRMCAGWVGCHGAHGLLSLRLAVARGELTAAEMDAAHVYCSPVPLFSSGAEAAAHGARDVEEPDTDAVRLSRKLARRRGDREAIGMNWARAAMAGALDELVEARRSQDGDGDG